MEIGTKFCAGRSGHMARRMFHSRAAPAAILAAALAAMTAALHDHAHAEGKLDASYTISFARLEVGDISATIVFGDSDYAISARGRAGGVMKALVDGEGSFAARGRVKDGHPYRQLSPPRSYLSRNLRGDDGPR